MKSRRKLEFDKCNKISYFTASNSEIRKEYLLSLDHHICLVYSFIDFFNFFSYAKCKSLKLQLTACKCYQCQLQSSTQLFSSCHTAGMETGELPLQANSQWLSCGCYMTQLPIWPLDEHIHFKQVASQIQGAIGFAVFFRFTFSNIYM